MAEDGRRRQMEPFPDARPADRAAPALREIRAFGPNPGALRLLACRPPGLPSRAPLVVVLHGCGQTAEAFATGAGWLALAEIHGFALLCPQQSRANNRAGCFNWFEPADIRPRDGEAASILQMIDHLLRTEDLDGERVFVTGLSAGGAMALALLAIAPQRFAAGAVIAGMPFDAAHGAAEAWLAMKVGVAQSDGVLADRIRTRSGPGTSRPRLSVWQGLADTTVAPANALRIAGQWRDLCGLPLQPDEITASGILSVSRWGGEPAPLRLTLVAGLGHGVPVDAARPGGGAPGRFLIDNGVASSLEIAADWGLTAPPARPVEVSPAADPPAAREPDARRTIGERLRGAWRRLAGRRR